MHMSSLSHLACKTSSCYQHTRKLHIHHVYQDNEMLRQSCHNGMRFSSLLPNHKAIRFVTFYFKKCQCQEQPAQHTSERENDRNSKMISLFPKPSLQKHEIQTHQKKNGIKSFIKSILIILSTLIILKDAISHLKQQSVTMKFAAVLALIAGSASAFSPIASNKTSSTALQASLEGLPGALPPVGPCRSIRPS